ncbi:hypothetical protein [Hydrogenophaga taeniospiralis]|uniref:hypothetical protein n=1 Tax=Hydrogenophaga taeniospiralis TaxID=65656 RepID=UPI001CFBA01D|nr:hypothetical protein [Hydrogenophaga taeniospiralis]UCU94975.1 hypothetical protein KI616_03605 [Hydrogenophaga taeniospiralis]
MNTWISISSSKNRGAPNNRLHQIDDRLHRLAPHTTHAPMVLREMSLPLSASTKPGRFTANPVGAFAYC